MYNPPSSPLRLFIGYPMPADVRRATHAWRATPLTGARWTTPENLHITLTFIGDTPAERLPELQAALAEIGAYSLEIVLDRVGQFPPPANVLWLGMEDNETLIGIKRRCDMALEPLGIPYDRKLFVPHVTLARLKAPLTAGEMDRFREHMASFLPQRALVEGPVLFASMNEGSGVRYIAISKR